jgi:hypothetical protein
MNEPLLLAQNFYFLHGRDFDAEFIECLSKGFVSSAPNYFIMGKAVELPPKYLNGKVREGWLIAMLCGDMSAAFIGIPFYLPFIAFYRRRNPEKLHIISTGRIIQRVAEGKQCHF